MIDFLLDVFEANREKEALIWRDSPVSYGWLLERVGRMARAPRAGRRPSRRRSSPSRPTFRRMPSRSSSRWRSAAACSSRSRARSPQRRPSSSRSRRSRRSTRSTSEDEARLTTLASERGAPVLRDAARARPPGPGPLLVGLDGQEQGRRPRPRGHPREVQGAAALAARDLVPPLRPHRRREHHALHAVQRGVHGDRAGPKPRRGPRGDRAPSCRAPPDLADVPQPRAPERGLQRHDLSSLKTVTYGTEPMPETHAQALPRAVPGDHSAADVRAQRSRDPAVEVAGAPTRCG